MAAIQPQGQWSSGILDFTDHCNFCLYAAFCPCWAYGDLSVKSRPAFPLVNCCPTLETEGAFGCGLALQVKLLFWQAKMSKGRAWNSGQEMLTTVRSGGSLHCQGS